MIKKIIAILLTLCMLLCVCACKEKGKTSSDLSVESGSGNLSSDSTSKVENDTTNSTNDASDSIGSNMGSTSNTSSVTSNPVINNTSSVISSQGDNPYQSGKVTATIIADTNREPSTDVSSCIDSGYIYYYDPEAKDFSAVLRRSLNGGEPEVVFDFHVDRFTVLNGTVYYTKDGGIYSCTAEKCEPKLIYKDANVDKITVAGEWIICDTIDTDGGKAFGFISLDGKQRHIVRPKMPYENSNDFKCTLTYYGFNRGYFYYNITYTKTTYQSGSNMINVSTEIDTVQERLDYRSKEFKTATLLNDASFKYNGGTYSAYDFKNIGDPFINCEIAYDYIIQYAGNDKFFSVSLSRHKGYDILIGDGSPVERVKGYIATCENCGYGPDFTLKFINMQGHVKRVSIPKDTGYTIDKIQLYSSQCIHTDGILLLCHLCEDDGKQLLYITPDGKITEIYTVFNNKIK